MLIQVDRLLRHQESYAAGGGPVPWIRLALITATCGFLYGAVMGSYGTRPLQALYSGLKVPLLLGISTVIGLPSFFVVNTLLGLRKDIGAAIRGILTAQATLAVCLASLAPVTVIFYLSIYRYQLAPLFNGIQFAIATLAGQWTLGHHYRSLVAANPRHRMGKITWLAVYIFVAIQMAWVLRPFIGAPGLQTQFFRKEAWSNAYVRLLEAIWDILAG